jgi:hypothetical protein
MRLTSGVKAGLLAISTGTALADAATPFLEGVKKVGDVETATARVIHIGADVYVVVVRSDTAEYFAIPAKAKDGVVAKELLNKSVTVKAKIASYTKREKLSPAVELEILSVK